MSWSFALANRKGAVHGSDEDGQDACDCLVVRERGLVAATADGAGSARFGGAGAKEATLAFLRLGRDLLCERVSVSSVTEADGRELVSAIRQSIVDLAREGQQEPRELSTTLVGALVFEDGAVFLQVGDGAAVARCDGDFEIMLWPEPSEYINTTNFVTDPDSADRMLFRRIEGTVRDLALLTDGLQYLVIDHKERIPHQPFFLRMSERLAAVPGHDEEASRWLEAVLASDQVTKRSDDDTSIIIAKRCQS
jgi:hypothetical protein